MQRKSGTSKPTFSSEWGRWLKHNLIMHADWKIGSPPRHKRRVEDYASDVEEKDKKRRPSMQAKVLFWNRFVAHIRD